MNLRSGITGLGLTISSASEEKLGEYLALLAKWNKTYNLTAIHDERRMVTHHLLDSLAVLPHLVDVTTIADVGSGAGLPGILLAICRPDLRLTSIETSQKKAAFQQQVKIELGLSNVSIHCGRVEGLKGIFDAAISRAFADLATFAQHAGHLASCLLAMKGAYPKMEIDRLPTGWRMTDNVKLDVPGLDAERHLIVLRRS